MRVEVVGPAGPQDYQDIYESEWIKIGQV